jgi:hypothetical protein
VVFERDDAVPPNLRDATALPTRLSFRADPTSLDDAVIARLRETATKDARVRGALGTRFAFISCGHATRDKGRIATQRADVLTFYSYSRNLAVDVEMAEGQVTRVDPRRPGHQPEESSEETRVASDLVKKDARFPTGGASLFVRGIVTPSADGHRHLYLLFFKREGRLRGAAVFEAMVDATAGQVVSARDLPGR